MPTLTQAQYDALIALIDAPTSRPRKTKAKSTVRTFRTLVEREAGQGFPCTAPEPCTRTDLRTASGAGSHEQSTEHGWHIAK